MSKANVKIIEELKNFVQYVFTNKEVLLHFTGSPANFTRNRKLPFPDLILLIVRLCKKTLSIEIEKFFEEMGVNMSCSVSAFTQQRLKLNASFFYSWNLVLWLNFYRFYSHKVKRWRGYRVLAIDGSSVSLINNEALKGYFGGRPISIHFLPAAKRFIAMMYLMNLCFILN